MRLAKPARANPRAHAASIIAALPANELIARTEIAGPGFINFFMTPAAWQAEVARVHAAGAAYGRGDAGSGRGAIVEFVSANPTGPLHVGHGRHAAFGATVANLLEADGWRVHREYYVNDAGRQMDILAASVWLRYLEACGETIRFPANGYRGDYVRPIAAALHARHGDAFRRPAGTVFAGLPVLPRGGIAEQDLYVFTGSVIAAQGGFHIYYTGHNPPLSQQDRPEQGVMHAVSPDLYAWQKVPEETFFAPIPAYEPHDWRDPFVF